MRTTKRSTTITGLDIEPDSIAAAAVTLNGSISVGETGIAPLAPGIARDGEISDPDALAEALKALFAEHKLPKTVRVGIANQRVVVRTLRMPVIDDPGELESAIRFQAPDHIPMALEQAVIDWQVLDDNPELRRSGQMDVVVVAARRDMVEGLADALHLAGLKPVGIDISAFAMIRAVANEAPNADLPTVAYEDRVDEEVPVDSFRPARLLCNFGDTTNLAVARGSSCLFTRVSHFGLEGIVQRLSERRGLTLEHSRQWLLHVGLVKPVEEIDGDPETVSAAREALVEGLKQLAGELRLSLDYYGAQEGAVDVQEIVVCGAGSAIEGVAEQIQSELGYVSRVARPLALSHLDPRDAARLTLPLGLGLEN
jgi:type IV pilus assembly protein PilM